MQAPVLVIAALVVALAGYSQQEPIPEGRGYSGGEGGSYGAGQGLGGGHEGAGGLGGPGGSAGGFGGQGGGFGGSGGADGRYGFNIVDTDDRYGYESNIPGAKASFFLLGPNRGPGARRGGGESGW